MPDAESISPGEDVAVEMMCVWDLRRPSQVTTIVRRDKVLVSRTIGFPAVLYFHLHLQLLRPA